MSPTIIQDDYTARAFLLSEGLLCGLKEPAQSDGKPWVRSCLAEAAGHHVLGIRIGGYDRSHENGYLVVILPAAQCSTEEWAALARWILSLIVKPGSARMSLINFQRGLN